MDDKRLIFLGTLFLIIFNILVVLFGIIVWKELAIWGIIAYIIIFGISAIYFDFLVIRYYVNKIKEKKGGK